MENKWDILARINDDPEAWIRVYKHYQELLTREDVADWYAGQFDIACRDRNELKKKIFTDDELKEIFDAGYLYNARPNEPDFEQLIALIKSKRSQEL